LDRDRISSAASVVDISSSSSAVGRGGEVGGVYPPPLGTYR